MKERTLKDLGLGAGDRKTHILEESFNIDELFNSYEDEKEKKSLDEVKKDLEGKV